MNANWKRLFVWSSLGGLAVGATVSFARKSRKPASPSLVLKEIPSNCQRISIWTERFWEANAQCLVYDHYSLQATPFKQWNVIDLRISPDQEGQGGVPIYHATLVRYVETGEGNEVRQEAQTQDRFYGTVSMLTASGESSRSNCLARGGILQIRKCNVGGANNGIETGEIHHSSSPILNYRFEYGSGR